MSLRASLQIARPLFAVLVLLTCSVKPSPALAATCESLKSLSIPDLTISSAQTVAAGKFTPPTPPAGAAPAASPYANLPAFCRVLGTVKRAGDTDMKIEVWMPLTGWNGDFQPAASQFGGGTIAYADLSVILRSGAATATTNRGHDSDAPPRWKSSDISSKAYHLMVVPSKAIVKAFYTNAPKFAVMNECGGSGSRDALQLVQDYPADLDLATAIGFTNWGTHHGVAHLWVWQATHETPASFIPKSKYQLIHQGALDACDAKDGVKDGIIEDPERCAFDPGVLQCKGADGPNCLTVAQVKAVRTIYATPVHARTGAYLYGSMPPGGEMGWEEMADVVPYPFSQRFYRDQIYKDPKWDWNTRHVNFDKDVDVADSPEYLPINATNPDISKFIDRGGKLLLMGGWNDHTLGPGNNVHYYETVVAKLGAQKIQNSVRLFMVPGMDHCLGDAYGPKAQYPTDFGVYFDPIQAMKEWKATGKAPDQIVVTTKGKAERKRLVCAYPKVSQFKGTGNTDDPANFVCKAPDGPKTGH